MSVALHDQILPGTFIQQLEGILNKHNERCHRTEYHQKTGRQILKKTVSRRTVDARAKMLKLSFAELWQLGYRLKEPAHLKQNHCEALVKHWIQNGHSPAYIQTRVSVIRVFSVWLGKTNMVRPTPLMCPNGEARRTQAAAKSLAWKDSNVNAQLIVQKADLLDVRFGAMLKLQSEFGLRVKESIEICPNKSISFDGRTLTVWAGTKGGRQRFIAIVTESQREAVEHAIKIASQHPSGRLRWPGHTWTQAQNRFYRLTGKLGITRSDLGVTAHGLRHEFAQTQYRKLTGLPTPVEGGNPKNIDIKKHRAASMDVTNALGHSRLSVTTAYYGTYSHQLRAPVRYTFSFQKNL